MSDFYDLIAIGAGPAGDSATELAAFFGHRCAVIERDRPGGTVTTSGGVPTKTLREAALYYTGFRDRAIYGLGIESPPTIMLDAIRKRTWDVCETLQHATEADIKRRGVDYLHGVARLTPDRSVEVTTDDGARRTLRARAVLIATGSRPAPPGAGLPVGHPGVCDTDTILRRGHPPRALLIVGGGPVAAEFATIASALGIAVTIVSRERRLLEMMDDEITSRLAALMAEWGVRFVAGATLQAATAQGEWLHASLSTGESLVADTILLAAGRIGNTEDLGLEAAGVATDARGRIAVDERYRTTAAGVYAAGDVIGPGLASVAMEQGRAAACHALGISVSGLVDPTPVWAVYTMPEVARVGLTEDECRDRGLAYEVGRAELGDTPRGAIAGRGGLLKLVFLTESRRLVGVHCIGDIASEVAGIGQMAIRCGATIHTLTTMTLSTPTYGYAYKYAAFDGIRRLQGGRHDRQQASASDLQPGP